eukprot:6200463-Pleurochrysis_carterae.AAC.1
MQLPRVLVCTTLCRSVTQVSSFPTVRLFGPGVPSSGQPLDQCTHGCGSGDEARRAQPDACTRISTCGASARRSAVSQRAPLPQAHASTARARMGYEACGSCACRVWAKGSID